MSLCNTVKASLPTTFSSITALSHLGKFLGDPHLLLCLSPPPIRDMNENKPIYSKTSQKIFLRIGKKHLFLQWMCYHTNPPNSWIHIIWVVILCTTLNFKKMGRRCSSKSAKCFIWSARPSRLLGHSRHIHIYTTYKTD